MPMEGDRMVIEPNYPRAADLMAISGQPEPEEENDGTRIRNVFWCQARKQNIIVYEKNDGRVDWAPGNLTNAMDKLLSTLSAADAWGIEQEANAVNTLGTLLRHRQFKQYLLTGMFMERSPRSDVSYLFRRLRPTIAITSRSRRGGEGLRILAALCLHPIGYYENSWAGAMCPTDDVIAHLMLMRGDEHMFWKRANQHAAWDPNAGIV
jgi:hypothetical protein